MGDIGDYGFMRASADDLVISRDPARETLWELARLYDNAQREHDLHKAGTPLAVSHREGKAEAARSALRIALSGLYGFSDEDADDRIADALPVRDLEAFVGDLLGP